MSTWLYQLNAEDWSPETFRCEIWEGRSWHWSYGRKQDTARPEPGDTIVFFYAPSGCTDPGFYGWAVLERHHPESPTLYFLPAAPTNLLKMDPWWDDDAKKLVDAIRGKMTQATLFRIKDEQRKSLRAALRTHLGGASGVTCP